jgi:hypothetical protein
MYYIVIRDFNDAQDNNYAYHVGDVFPHDGRHIPENRIQDLATGRNFQRVPLITKINGAIKLTEKDVEKADNDAVVWTEEDIRKMPYMKLKSVAKQNGVEVKDKEASDIRAELIEKLGI